MPKFAAKQIVSWLYEKKVVSIDEMTNLSLKHREMLKGSYEIGASAPVEAMRSVDGTVKSIIWLIVEPPFCVFYSAPILRRQAGQMQ